MDFWWASRTEHVWPALHAFRKSIKASVGLEVRFDKMHAYIADMEAARREAPADIEWPELDGHHDIAVLNVPLGSPEYVHAYMRGKAEELREEVGAFAEAVDATVLAAVERVLGVSFDPSTYGTDANPVVTDFLAELLHDPDPTHGSGAMPRRCARCRAASKRLLLAISTTQMHARVMEREVEAASGSQKELTAFLDQANNSRLRNEVCALPVTCRERILFNQLDAASGMWTGAIPTARTVMTPHELREVAAGYFFLPSPCLAPVVGSQIIMPSTEHNPVTVDLYGNTLMNLPAAGDAHWRVQHDAIADAFRNHCAHDLGITVRREVDDLFQQAVPLGNTVPMDELKDQVPDAELSLPAFNVVTGGSYDPRSLKSTMLEFKTMRVGLSPEAVGGPAAQRWGNDGGSGVPGGTPYSPVPSSPSAGLLYHRQRPDVARDATPPPLPHPRSVPSPKLRAPSGYSSEETVSSDEEEGDWAARRRSAAPDGSRRVLRAPGGADDESSSSDDEEAAAWVWAAAGAGAEIGWSESAGVRRLSHAERELQEWREQQAARAQRASQWKASDLRAQLMGISLQEAEEVAAIDAEVAHKHEMAMQRDEEQQQRLVAERQQKLTDEQLRRQQQLKKAAEDLGRAEAAKRVAEEAERARQQAEQARRAAEEAERQRSQQLQERRQKEEAVAKAAEAAKAAKPPVATAAPPKAAGGKVAAQAARTEGGFSVRVAASAQEWQQACAVGLQETLSAIEPYEKDEGSKKERRALEKEVNKFVIQISATKDQVLAKTRDLVQLINARCQSDVQRWFALNMLAKKVLKQCESQVAEKHEFVYALGEVLVHVMAAFPVFVKIMVGHLHKVCILTVPKYYIYKKSTSGQDNDAEYFRRMCYKEHKEADRAAKGAFETTDDFLHRSTGYVLLYAAITQGDVNPHPHGLEHAWQFLARLLNTFPINRISATVLHSFLKVVGYKMFHIYRGQFITLLHCVYVEFLPELQKSADPDAKAVSSRLGLYINEAAYKRAPEGREMQKSDESASMLRTL
eukprot:jgi/Tetstr1/447082/TSEL_034520.t1